MRKLFVMFLMLFTGLVFATQAPYQPHDELLLSKGIMHLADKGVLLGDANGKGQVELLGVDGSMQKRIARATYDVAVDGGGIAAHALGVKLPANALMTRSWFNVTTQFTDLGGATGTVALSCEDADNIYAAADITGNAADANVDGVQDDTTANFTGSIAAECELTATVAAGAQTAGKLILFVEYLVTD